MRKRRKCRSPEEWRQLILIFEKSEMSRQDFCAQHDLGISTFGRWYFRFHQKSAAKLIPILGSTSSAIGAEENSQEHVRVANTNALASPLCATLPTGIRLEFDSDLSPAYLKQIIGAIHKC